ncbi:unnamed protein product [Camellia sinensis]
MAKSSSSTSHQNPSPSSSSTTTSVRVTALDGLVNVNSLFTIAVFVGLSLTTPHQHSLNPSTCDAGIDVAKKLLVFEVVSFSFFLFSSLVAQGLKLAINILNSRDVDEAFRAHINIKVLRFGMVGSAVGSMMGCLFLMLSMINVVEIKLGTLSCGSKSTVISAAALIVLVTSGLLVYVSTAVYAGNQPGVLQRVGSAAGFVLSPFNFFISSSGEATRRPLADNSLHVLLILIYYRKCVMEETLKDKSDDSATSDFLLKENTYFSENSYCKALENVRDIEFDQYLADETAILLLYSLVHGNSDFLEYVMVRTDLDALLMPMLETLYNASKGTSNQIYMVLIILLILSQDSSFNASIHKLMLPSVPWYQERLLHQTSLGSLMIIILIRTVNYNLSKLRDICLHTNCLAILANMAPHVHCLSAYASQRLVNLFDMLSRKYTKLAELKNDKMRIGNGESRGDSLPEEMVSTELHIYTDFLRIVLEILNAILTYALPRNPELYMRLCTGVFQPSRNHPRFNELLENILTVLDFFNSRMDAQRMNGEWSVEKVLKVIIINCRSWRGEGMKDSFSFNPSSLNLFPVDLPIK